VDATCRNDRSFDTATLTVPNASGQSLEANYVAQASAGASGVKTATASANADVGAAHILALRANPAAFTPGNFNAYDTGTAAGAISGFIKTKIAGTTISIDVVALNGAKTAILTTFLGAVKVEISTRATTPAHWTRSAAARRGA
jgi:hypothetical protein